MIDLKPDTPKKRVTLTIPSDTLKTARILAVHHERSLSDVVSELLTRWSAGGINNPPAERKE